MNDGFTDALPDVANAVGTPQFEKQLADALGTQIAHDFITMARYSVNDEPRFLIHSHSFPSHLADLYLSKFIHSDPYLYHWRETEAPGVVWLQDIATARKRYKNYTDVFLPEIGVKDEIAVFMPAVDHDSIAFFYNNRKELFTPHDVMKLRQLFNTVAALYRLHIRMLLNGDGQGVDASPSLGRPLRVTNSTGSTIWITNEWSEQGAPDAQLVRTPIDKEFETHQRYLWTLAPPDKAGSDRGGVDFQMWANQIRLTPREKDIVSLTLKGNGTSGIAKNLGLSAGNIKNHKRRIYNKLDITGERELFLMYIEAMSLKITD